MTCRLLNILMIFGIKENSIILYCTKNYNVLLAIATNIPMRLMTGFVVQGHIYHILGSGSVFAALLSVFERKMSGCQIQNRQNSSVNVSDYIFCILQHERHMHVDNVL